ncbi:OR45A protein, partial [Pseudoatta argentina]
MDIVFDVNNVDDFAINTLLLLSIVTVCCKSTVIVVRRIEIINLVQVLLKAPYKPRDENEIAIQTKFDRFIRSCSIKYSLLATSSITGGTIGSVLNVMQGHLPYRIWLPCNYNVSTIFWTTSIHQMVTIIFATMINVGTETLIFGLILQTCAQFEILESRLHKLIINKTVKYLGHASCLLNENKAGLYAKAVNVIFNQVLFVQFFSSILVLCTSVYHLSIHIKDLSAITMFVQIYIYCWSGNEVIFKSMSIADAIYNTNWPLLSINEKRGLLMIMTRCTIPVKFTSSFLITLSLQSYSNVNPIMQILSLNFFIYTIGGVWRLVEWSSNGAKLLYNIFTFMIISSEYFLLLTQFMDIIFVVNNVDDFATNTLMFLSIVAVCCKITVVVVRRNAIINLVQILLKAPYKPQDEDEIAVQAKFNKFIRYAKAVNVTFNQVLFVQFFSSTLVLCTSVYYLSMHIKELSAAASLLVYTVCMFVQIFVYCWSGNEVMLKSTSIADAIYRMNWPLLSINEKKGLLMIMIRSTIPVKFTSSFLSVELGDEIYHMDWILMTRSEQLDLLMIMKRSTKPIKFTSSFLVTLSLESYSNVSI